MSRTLFISSNKTPCHFCLSSRETDRGVIEHGTRHARFHADGVVIPSAGLLWSAPSLSDVPAEPALWPISGTLHSQVHRFQTPAYRQKKSKGGKERLKMFAAFKLILGKSERAGGDLDFEPRCIFIWWLETSTVSLSGNKNRCIQRNSGAQNPNVRCHFMLILGYCATF